ncbi:MAG: DUF1549 and DUF1553 domain-containing protein [Verrucomicrobiae bacterium]|nr:DUF1549 and DUF1553 domain-containing protein [Verrucomicrobiae bacterium]NNJ87520.1 DUF1553 domain-containing protein [Akkermansiaceae bacterium]
MSQLKMMSSECLGICRQSIGLPALGFILTLGMVGSGLQAAEQHAAKHTAAAPDPVVVPYESADHPVPPTKIDHLVHLVLQKHGIKPARPCSDEVFIRRVFVDLIGTLPTRREVVYFSNSTDPRKRAKLIEVLMTRDEFTDYWTLKWCDLLRVKSEFPVNLWPNGVQAYHRWIRDAVKENRPYDVFARQLLTSSGSNFRQPAVNFYRAVQGTEPEAIAEMVALTFMGVRTEHWSDPTQKEFAAFFSRIAYKKTVEWKEEIVYLDPTVTEPLVAVFPDRKKVTIPAGEDPRVVFADWLITPQNPWFTRSVSNRVWYWLMGRGIIHEPDDIRPNNPVSNLALLTHLQTELVRSNYNIKHLFRLILNSQTYQQSCIPHSDHKYAGAFFAHYTMRRLDAEVLVDALNRFGNTREKYWSPIPEPFTFIPEDQRTITLSDGSITSQFLEMFGRPSRDKGYESERETKPTEFQRLYMLNSTEMHARIWKSPQLRQVIRESKGDPHRAIRLTYLTILSRRPTTEETRIAIKHFKKSRKRVGINGAVQDLAWALLNTKEFLYKH